jgi:hypothetical protein
MLALGPLRARPSLAVHPRGVKRMTRVREIVDVPHPSDPRSVT